MERFYVEATSFYSDHKIGEGDRRSRSDPDPGGIDRPGDHFQITAYQPGPDHISEDHQ